MDLVINAIGSTAFLDTAAILIYLIVRDRLMRNAILQLASETEGVDRGHVADQLRIRGDD